jgi:two-component system, OmpR family, alkaline phosphatase synthesis response regulator PhoP
MPTSLLVIDDETGIRHLIRYAIEAVTDWQVYLADSGAAGIAEAIAQRPDAILLDVMMPDLDGFATVERLQANQATRAIPIILLTAGSGDHQRLKATAGVVGVIAKPFKSQTLAAQIVTILSSIH